MLFVASSQVLVFKNVSRKGAKEQREKENSFDVVLLVEICQRLRNRSDAEPAEDARRIEWFQREIGTTTSFAPKVDLVVTRFVLVRVNSWIVLISWTNGTIHDVTRTRHEPKYFSFAKSRGVNSAVLRLICVRPRLIFPAPGLFPGVRVQRL